LQREYLIVQVTKAAVIMNIHSKADVSAACRVRTSAIKQALFNHSGLVGGAFQNLAGSVPAWFAEYVPSLANK
jgi:hypothetical protein